MKFINLILVCVFAYSCTSATNEVELSLLSETISLSNDTIEFKYRITNNSSKDLVFFNSEVLDFDGLWVDQHFLQDGRPRVLFRIVDRNNEMSRYLRSKTDHTTRLDLEPDYTYIVLKHNESIIHTAKESLWPINLQKGSYTLQLVYFSNNYYEDTFSKMKERNPKLKNAVLYKGYLKSNIYSITYPTF